MISQYYYNGQNNKLQFRLLNIAAKCDFMSPKPKRSQIDAQYYHKKSVAQYYHKHIFQKSV